MNTPARKHWPYPHVVNLYAHGIGMWAISYRDKTYFFGAVDEPDAALVRWAKRWPAIVAGTESTADRIRAIDHAIAATASN